MLTGGGLLGANANLDKGYAHDFGSGPNATLVVSLPGAVGFSKYGSFQKAVKPGDYIYKQGSPATEVFFIHEGLASLVHSSPNSGLSTVVGFANAGKYMGLPEFFKSLEGGDINYKTSAIAEAPSFVLAFEHNTFEDIYRGNYNIEDTVTRMVAEMSLKYLERGSLNARQKVAAYFGDLILYSRDVPGSPAQQCGVVFENDDAAVEIRKTHKQIGEATGNSRELITRLFRETTVKKLITTKQGKIWIHNPKALYEFLGYHPD